MTIGFYVVITGLFSMHSNWLPQIRGEVPPSLPKLDSGSVNSMTTQDLADIGEMIIFGKVGGYIERGIGKGQCPLCHTFKPGDIGDRAPNLFGIVKRAAERIKELRYLNPDTVQQESFPGSGRATTADEYIAESHVCVSCYVVQGYGVKGSNDRESPMAPDHKPPIGLTIEEMIAVHTWLYVHDGETPPSPKQIRTDHEKFIPETERHYAGSRETTQTLEPVRPLIALASDSLGQLLTMGGCGACHQIPGIAASRFAIIGPLLISGATASRRIASLEYQARVKAGMAHAETPKEYIIESIVNPNAFVVSQWATEIHPGVSPMSQNYGDMFTYTALDKLADHLLTLDCEAAKKDGLSGPPQESVSKICDQ